MSANLALYSPGAFYPLTRGYSYRSSSTQAHEMDRNLMFYYEHLQLYNPNLVPRHGSPGAETRAARDARTSERAAAAAEEEQQRDSPPEITSPLFHEEEPDVDDEVDKEDERSPSTSPTDSVESLMSDSPSSPEPADSAPTPMDEHIQPSLIPDDAPPSYQNPPTDRCHPPAYQAIPDSLLLPDPPFCSPSLAESLRRFLLFCLAIDYDLVSECPEKLREADWLPFLRLARHWSWKDTRRRFLQGYDVVRPACLGFPSPADRALDEERAVKVEECIFACVVRPAQALGLPPDLAITLLNNFPSSLTSTGSYHPYNTPYRLPPTTKTLATKLLLDREILFDTVTKREHWAFRAALHEANERVRVQMFVWLRSPGDYGLTEFGRLREGVEGSVGAGAWGGYNGLGDLGDGVGVGGAEAKTGRKRLRRWVRKLSSA